MSYNMRPMQIDDIRCVHAIELSSHRAPWLSKTLNDCVSVGYDCRVLEVHQEKKWKIIGYIISRYRNNVCHVLNVCVDPVFQNQGYGRIILQDQIDSIKDAHHINTLYLEVRPSNKAALSLYYKMGFKQAGIKKDYYNDDAGIEDAVVLEKKINT